MSALPTGVSATGQPSQTAHWVALLRAAHQLLDEPLVLPDPVALALLGPRAEAALRADPFALNDPLSRGLRAALVVRSRFVEDELARAFTQGVRQYVVLGAGLDSYACRPPGPPAGLRVFELDHAATQRWKRQRLAEAGIAEPAALRFVPVDFERDDLRTALADAGFSADQPACIGWMGVTPYLSGEAMLRMLGTMAGFAPGSSICFDYRVPRESLDPIERAVDEVLAQKAAAAGEPWLSAFEPQALQGQLLEAGFRSADSHAPDALNARYFARRKDGLRTGGGLRIMRACTGARG